MKIHVQGTQANFSETYEGEDLHWDMVQGFIHIFEGKELIGTHRNETWANITKGE